MAKKVFLVDIDLSHNELQNAIIQTLASDPTTSASDTGLFYYNTNIAKLKVFNGTTWDIVGADLDLYVTNTTNFGTNGDIPVLDGNNKNIKGSGIKATDLEDHLADNVAHRKHLTESQNSALDGNTALGTSNHVADKDWVSTAMGNKIDKVPAVPVGNISVFIAGGGLKDGGYKLNDSSSNTDINALWSANKIREYVSGEITSIGGGDVSGPSSSTDSVIAVFSGTTGKLIKEGTKKISDLALSGDLEDHINEVVPGKHHLTVDQNAAIDGNAALNSGNQVVDFSSINTVTRQPSNIISEQILMAGAQNRDIVDTGISKSDLTTSMGASHSHNNKVVLDKIDTEGSRNIITVQERTDINKALFKDGTNNMTASLDMSNNFIQNLKKGVLDTDGVTVEQLNEAVAGGTQFRGGYDASTNLVVGGEYDGDSLIGTHTNPVSRGDMYNVTATGTPTGCSLPMSSGDYLIANADVAPGTNIVCSDWTVVRSIADAASETVAGVIEVATQAEVDNVAIDKFRAVTPETLAGKLSAMKAATVVTVAVPSGALTATIDIPGYDATKAIIQVRSTLGDEYQFRVTGSGNTLTLTANSDIPAGLTAWVTAPHE